jgi:cytidine deaminase
VNDFYRGQPDNSFNPTALSLPLIIVLWFLSRCVVVPGGELIQALDVFRLMTMNDSEIDRNNQLLIDAAIEVLRKNAHAIRHSVGAAVLCSSGQIYTGINIESSGYGVCAEPIALGAALSQGERKILSVVAVCNRGDGFMVLSPCGNCRQMLLDYAPEAIVIYMESDGVTETKARNLLPGAYVAPDMADI